MKYIAAILVALMAMVGFATACVAPNFGDVNWGISGDTAGASYYESGSAYLTQGDTFDMSTTFMQDNKGGLAEQGFMTTSDPRDGDGTHFGMTQQMNFIKDFSAPIDPSFRNSVDIQDGTVGLSWFAGSDYNGVEMGMAMDNLYNPSHFSFVADSELTHGYMYGSMANNAGMYYDAKSKFSFDRVNQLYTGAIQFNATKAY
jgi:hypothetical protein